MENRRDTLRRTLCALVAAVAVLLLAGAASARGATVTVRPGDTLSAIAARAGTTVGTLVRLNGIRDRDAIVAGRRLRVPGPGTAAGGGAGAASYLVRPGDTLGGIAARHGVSLAALAGANGIRNPPGTILAGSRLVIPGGGGAAPSAGPAGGSHRVLPGETLGGIAARYGTSIAALAALNGIADPSRVAAGRLLRIPAGATPSPGSGATTPGVSSLIALHAGRYGVDPALARAIAWQESRWIQSARSSVGAIGVMQLMPATARWFGPAVLGRRIDPHLLEDNIEGGVAYLGWLTRQSGSTRVAIMAYYQGLASLRHRGPYDDTRAYLASVMAFYGRV